MNSRRLRYVALQRNSVLVERSIDSESWQEIKRHIFSEGLNLELRQFIAKRHSGTCAPTVGASIRMQPLQRCRNRQVGSVVSG